MLEGKNQEQASKYFSETKEANITRSVSSTQQNNLA